MRANPMSIQPRTGGPRFTEGQIVWNQGYEFIVTNVWFTPDALHPGYEIMRYTGICTAHRCNDSIRNGGYNGGTYGYRVVLLGE